MAYGGKVVAFEAANLIQACMDFLYQHSSYSQNGRIHGTLLQLMDVLSDPRLSEDEDVKRFLSANKAFQSLGVIINTTNKLLNHDTPPTAYEAEHMNPLGMGTLLREDVEAWLLMNKDEDLRNLCEFGSICDRLSYSDALSGTKYHSVREQVREVGYALKRADMTSTLQSLVAPKIEYLEPLRNRDEPPSMQR